MRVPLLFACLTALGLTAFAAFAPPAEAQGQLRVGMRDDPDILDPTFSRTYVGTLVMTALCDKLFDFDANLNIVPVLATSYAWTDTQTLLIHLRPGVTFQDGEALDAAAVAYTLQRHLTASGSFMRSEIGAMDHAEAVDNLTVRVVMKQPFSPFVAILTDRAGMMLPPRATEAGGKDFGLHPVCAGPFRFVDRVAQDHVTLERFPGYWDAARIHYDRVTYRIIPDSSVRLANLQAGTLDIAEIAPLDADTVKRDARLRLVTVQSLGYGALTINTGAFPRAETPLGRDPRVRRAFELSLDRVVLSQVVFAGMYAPNAQATSALSPLYDPAIVPPGRDVAKARALLKEAGVTVPLAVPLTVANTPQGVQAGEVIQSMAAEAGFAVQVNAMEFGAALAAVRRGDFAMTLGGWSGLLDTDSNAWSFLHSDGALNMARYGNASVDAKLDAARAVSDIGTRRELYDAVWLQVSQDLPLIYLWTPRNIAGVSNKVAGFTLLADGLYRLQDVRPEP
ncbi:MAG TPA: ABC transporter substrate-binding protein [Acetobacteraceae bacterium]|nr:ABC transporter substrate-binding protein [Acetobacteraceae bacterium]